VAITIGITVGFAGRLLRIRAFAGLRVSRIAGARLGSLDDHRRVAAAMFADDAIVTA